MYKISKENLPKLYAALSEQGMLLLPCKNKAGKVTLLPMVSLLRWL